MSHTLPSDTLALAQPHRRAVIGAIAATALLGLPISPMVADGDKALLELGRQLASATIESKKAHRRLDVIADRYANVKKQESEGSAEFDQAHSAWRHAENDCMPADLLCANLRRQIAVCPATTMQGVMLKVGVASGGLGAIDEIDANFADEIDDGSAESLALSIVRDLRQMEGSTLTA